MHQMETVHSFVPFVKLLRDEHGHEEFYAFLAVLWEDCVKYFGIANNNNLNSVQRKCPLLPRHFGRTLDWYLRRLAREVIFIPKTHGHCTAFQFSLNTRELCFCR